jgi:hypothetical protein
LEAAKKFHGVGIRPLSKILAVKAVGLFYFKSISATLKTSG